MLRDPFLPRDDMLARYVLSSCVRLSVRLSVCLSQIGFLLRWLNLGSRKQRLTVAHGFPFAMPKISAKFQRVNPQHKPKIKVVQVQIGDFRPTSGYISKTVQDRDIIKYPRIRMTNHP